MPRDQRDIVIGAIVAPFGIRGEVKVAVTTDFPERFNAGNQVTLRIDDEKRSVVKIESSRPQKGGYALKLQGVDTRTDAEGLRGVDIVISEDELTELPEGEFYIFDLMGLKVVTDDGRDLGEVTEVLQSGSNDVYVTSSGVCIPALKDVVTKIDLAEGTMLIHPVPGLLADK